MADINLSRRALIPWRTVSGDTFIPGPVSFVIDDVEEDFSGSTLTMTIKKDGKVIKQLTVGDGIEVSGNILQYSISASDMETLFCEGAYSYNVEKEISGVIASIQYGTINIQKRF